MKHRVFAWLLICALVLGLAPGTSFAADGNGTPLDVVLLFDRSSEMSKDDFAAAKQAAKALVDSILSLPGARVGIVTFDQTAHVRYHPSASKTLLKLSLDLTSRSLLSANIEAGLAEATNLLLDKGRAGAKKAVILLSRGRPTFYMDDYLDIVHGLGLAVTAQSKEKTLEQAHLTRDLGVSICAVSFGNAAGSDEENLLMAIQNTGFFRAAAGTSAIAQQVAAVLLAEEPPFDAPEGAYWTVGFAKRPLVPQGLTFYSYKPQDLPHTPLYDKSVFGPDLSFDPADIPGKLGELAALYEEMAAAPGRYPESMRNSLASFLNLVLPLEVPFNPVRLAGNAARFDTYLAEYEPLLSAALADLQQNLALLRRQRMEAYLTQGLSEAEAAARADADMAALAKGDATSDEAFHQLYAERLSAVETAHPLPFYSDEREPSHLYMAGYSNELPAKGYIDENHVRAVYLDDNTGRGGVVLVNVETVGMSRNDINRIRDELAPFMLSNGIRAVHILSAHNHATIDTMGLWGPILGDGKDSTHMAYVKSQITDAVVEAYYNRRDGNLYAGTADAAAQAGYEIPLVEDTRYPEVTRNAELVTRLRFAPFDGSQELYIVHFGVHLEALQGKNVYSSADFLDPFGEYLRQHAGAEFIYFTGAIGGLLRTTKDHAIDPDLKPKNELHKYWLVTQTVGRRLGELVCGIGKADETELAPRLNLATRTFEVKLDNYLLALMGHLGFITTDIRIKDLESGLLNTARGFRSVANLLANAAKAVVTFGKLIIGGASVKDAFAQAVSGFAQAYVNMISDNLASVAMTEMSYLELYEKGGGRAKGIVLLPGEIFAELVYGGLLENVHNDWSLDPHNPVAANPPTFVEIAAEYGKTYGEEHRDLLVFGLADDMMGYIVPPNDFLLHPVLPYIENSNQGDKRRHYEETNSAGIHTAQIVADTFRALLEAAR